MYDSVVVEKTTKSIYLVVEEVFLFQIQVKIDNLTHDEIDTLDLVEMNQFELIF